MTAKITQLITEKELVDIGITYKKFTARSFFNILSQKTDTSTKDFLKTINLQLLLYQQNLDNRENNFSKRLTQAASMVIELIDYDNEKNYTLEDQRKLNIESDDFYSPLKHTSNPHNRKLGIIDNELKKSQTQSFNQDNPLSLQVIYTSMLILRNVLGKLNPTNALNIEKKDRPSSLASEFQALEQSKSDVTKVFIINLYKNLKEYTGHKTKYSTDSYTDTISGVFFELIKMCLIRVNHHLSDETIKNNIRKALKGL